MRTALGSGLLLLVASGLVAVPATADAATACDAPDTTWVGPATADGDPSWAAAANWTDGVPVAGSAVCVPAGTNADPEVQAGTTVTVAAVDASTAGVDVTGGSLTVTGPWDAARLGIHGGVLTLSGPSVLGDAVIDDQGHLTVAGIAHLTPLTEIRAHTESGVGTLEVASTGTLVLESQEEYAGVEIYGDLVNHGTVEAVRGSIDHIGLPPEEIPEGHVSDGVFSTGRYGHVLLGPVVFGDGALLDGVGVVDATIPAGATVRASGSFFFPNTGTPPVTPALRGAGELTVSGTSIVAAGVGEQVTVRVPAGEQAYVVETLEDHARLVVEGRALSPNGDLAVLDDAALQVTSGGTWDTTSEPYSDAPSRTAPLGRVVVDGGGRLVGGGLGSDIRGVLENHGTVRAASGPVRVLDPSGSLHDGVLTTGRWEVGPGAELGLSADVSRNEADVVLEGQGAVFHGLEALRTNAWSGSLALGRGATLPVDGALRNAGDLTVAAGGRLHTAGRFTQTSEGSLQLGVGSRPVGEVAVDGVRDLAGVLVLLPEAGAWPSLGTRRTLITSHGRATRHDAFDFVRAPRLEGLTAGVHYRAVRAWLRVDATPTATTPPAGAER